MTRLAFVLLALAACGGDDNNSMPDAQVSIDSPALAVQAVTCPATPDATVITMNSNYMPMSTTISQGQVVRFMLEASHDAEPGHVPSDSTVADPGLHVGFGETKCLMFTQTGMYGFHCGPHMFSGTIIVQ